MTIGRTSKTMLFPTKCEQVTLVIFDSSPHNGKSYGPLGALNGILINPQFQPRPASHSERLRSGTGSAAPLEPRLRSSWLSEGGCLGFRGRQPQAAKTKRLKRASISIRNILQVLGCSLFTYVGNHTCFWDK